MKKLRYLVLLVLLCMVFTACGGSDEKANDMQVRGYDEAEGKTYAFENANLKFVFNADTTQFSVTNKKTGEVTYSNPQDTDSDAIARGDAKGELFSTLTLKYTTKNDVRTTINNFNYSIENKLYTVEPLDNGVKVNYTIGNVERTYIMPIAVPESRMNEFIDKLDSKTKQSVRNYYRVLDLKKLRATDNKSELIKQYPDLKNERVYVVRENLKEYLRSQLEEGFEKAGYTKEDYQKDIERYKIDTSTDKPAFNVSVIYQLDENDLVVSVPLEDIEYNEKFPIMELTVLPYMGAASMSEQGYMLVPDGIGGIINFNNGKTGQASFYNQIYGWDYGMYRDAVVDDTQSDFPVFGIVRENNSFLCMIESGSAYATIGADISGKLNSYNSAKYTYSLIHGENIDIATKSDTTVRVFEKSLPKETIVQRYVFSSDSDYASLAKDYRDYLLNRYPELQKTESADVPVTVEYLGAVDTVEHVAGFPVTRPLAMTTYKEALKMTQELVGKGMKNMNIKYSGWFNKGLKHQSAAEVHTIGRLGSKGDLKKLTSYTSSNKLDMFMDANFSFIYKNGMFDSFSANANASKLVSRELVECYTFSPVWYGELEEDAEFYYFAKPSYSLDNITSYAKAIAKLGTNNISFADIGNVLGADYNPKKRASRESVMLAQQDKLKELQKKGSKVMLNGDNMYAVPYADFITNMPIDNKKTNIVDEAIPFYAIALHGLVPYAGQAVNLASDYETNLLRSVETGSGLYYVFTDEDAIELQDGRFTKYFATEYSKWKDTAIDEYNKLKESLDGTYNLFISDHKNLADAVTLTEYENGTKVIVNYSYADYNYEGKQVAARGYYVEKGGE